MKKIIHFQIPLSENNSAKDDYSISAEHISQWLTLIKNKIGKEYEIIASPFNPSTVKKDSKFYNFNMNQLTIKELYDMIEKDKDK
jgi:hypothetical protein